MYTACRLSPLSQHELTSASCQWKRYYNSQKIVLFDYLLCIVSLSPSWIKLRNFDIRLLPSRLLPAKDIVKRQMSTGVYVTASSYSHARWEVSWVIRVFVVMFLHVTPFERYLISFVSNALSVDIQSLIHWLAGWQIYLGFVMSLVQVVFLSLTEGVIQWLSPMVYDYLTLIHRLKTIRTLTVILIRFSPVL